jgi:hypothetical protein
MAPKETSMNFRCIAMTTEVASRFRKSRLDDRGNRVAQHLLAADDGPCRHCLGIARAGESLLLLSYDIERPQGYFWSAGPIFVHANECVRFTRDNEIPAYIRDNEKSLIAARPYDGNDQLLYDLVDVTPGPEVESLVTRQLCDSRTRYINIHFARTGCFFFRVEPL